MVSKEKFVELVLLKCDSHLTPELVAKKILEAEEVYDKQIVSSAGGLHDEAMSVLASVYSNRHNFMRKLEGPNPVWVKEETRKLQELWDTFDLLVKISSFNSPEGKSKFRNYLGQRP